MRIRRLFAHPARESCTVIMWFDWKSLSGTSGSFATYLSSTLNPTPVPDIRINIASSNALGSSIGR
ncbi:hypothetical protein ATCV1_z843R [Acanthocystis turfacea chlorella virus 1]|uniref:Uncharacterized protein z843R n=1 Tax=Chlorovirus heliozoae TaxID=322019 RepID=A7KAA3_9PHYC|nr:hypothetical protein ATCV1_z843R [Acanthocystis turfacea chlorella virus 1]ABT16977.1 hypothetical protein ATCV1_z843R [Acanthocystis turfacea chlorella virus 1]